MLRFTTNVTVSPASSARSSSAAARMSSITSGRVSANSAVSSSARQPRAVARLLDRGRRGGRLDHPLLAPARAAARDEAPVRRLDHVEHALGDPLGVDVLRVDAEPLGQRVALGRQALAHLMRRRERMLGRDVVAVGRQPAEVGRARAHELQPPVGEVRRHLDPDVGHQPPALGDQPLHVRDRDRRRPVGQRQLGPLADPGRARAPRPPPRRSRPAPGRSSAGAGRSSGGSPPGGARTRRAPPRAPPARRRARPRSRRCRRGSRS